MELSNKRIRSANFTKAEESLLLGLLDKYKHIIERKRNDAVTNKQKDQVWIKVSEEFNVQSGLYARLPDNLKSKYDNLKRAMKRSSLMPVKSETLTSTTYLDSLTVQTNSPAERVEVTVDVELEPKSLENTSDSNRPVSPVICEPEYITLEHMNFLSKQKKERSPSLESKEIIVEVDPIHVDSNSQPDWAQYKPFLLTNKALAPFERRIRKPSGLRQQLTSTKAFPPIAPRIEGMPSIPIPPHIEATLHKITPCKEATPHMTAACVEATSHSECNSGKLLELQCKLLQDEFATRKHQEAELHLLRLDVEARRKESLKLDVELKRVRLQMLKKKAARVVITRKRC